MLSEMSGTGGRRLATTEKIYLDQSCRLHAQEALAGPVYLRKLPSIFAGYFFFLVSDFRLFYTLHLLYFTTERAHTDLPLSSTVPRKRHYLFSEKMARPRGC